MPMSPSAVMLPALLAAFARPFLRSQSTAGSILPLVSVSAALQSIMPAPVRSRSSLTICAVMFAMSAPLVPLGAGQRARVWKTTYPRPAEAGRATMTALLGAQFLRPGNPAFHAAGQADFLADLVRRLRSETGDLPIVENAEIVELLLDRRRDMREFLEIVG